jgi:hypothetical protein
MSLVGVSLFSSTLPYLVSLAVRFAVLSDQLAFGLGVSGHLCPGGSSFAGLVSVELGPYPASGSRWSGLASVVNVHFQHYITLK